MTFPSLLTEKKQWLVWKFEQHEGDKKPRKVPYYCNGKKRFGKQGNDSDRTALATYSDAQAALEFGDYVGLGFAFLPDDGLIGIDIDSNADRETAQKIIAGLNSYTELSPSGNGWHIFVQGQTRTFKSNEVGIEVFCNSQFFTMTGKHVESSPIEVNPISEKALNRLREIVKPEKPKQPTQYKPQATTELQKIESALAYIPADCSYDEWFRIGAAIYSELGMSGLGLWDYWSSKSSKYNSAGMAKKYQSFADITNIHIATLFQKAQEHGWRPPRPVTAPPPAAPTPVAVIEAAEPEPEHDDQQFVFLGYNHDKFYFYQTKKRQIVEYTKSDFTETGLIALADTCFWDSHFHAKTGFDKRAAVEWVIQQSYHAGYFIPDRIRGRGACWDNSRSVFHFGSELSVNDKATPLHKIKSDYIYELSRDISIRDKTLMSYADGMVILNTAMMFRWSKPASAPLLCGWIFLSRLCGALNWRPHIWVTGEAGSGKSTIVDKFVYKLIGEHAIFAQGNSTEAGIRQTLRNDALPVLFDESEQNNDREQARVQNILSLIRQASSASGAQTLKGTATGSSMHFSIRSMFMLSSIQVCMLSQADIERISVLSIRPKRTEQKAADGWKKLESALVKIGLDETISDRMLSLSLQKLPDILENIRVFRDVCAVKFGSVRDGDQYGSLLAGCWSMVRPTIATPEQALEMINSYDWSEHRENLDESESTGALRDLMQSRLKMTRGGESTLHELLLMSTNDTDVASELNALEANRVLLRYGMLTTESYLLIGNNNKDITQLLKHTHYAADWRGQLLRVEGVKKYEKTIRINGVATRCVAIPLEMLGV